MDLTTTDHRFINTLIQSDIHRRILSERLQDDGLDVSPRSWRANALRSLARLVLLGLEFISLPLRRCPKDQPEIIFYDSNPKSLTARQDYLYYHRPEELFHGISYRDPILATPNKLRILSIIVQTGLLLLRASLRPSELSGHYTHILRTCLLIYSHVATSANSEVYLFRIYQPESVFSAAYLQDRGIFVHLIPSTTPLAPRNSRLIGDSLKICNPYQRDEFAYYRHLGTCQQAEDWSPEEIVQMNTYYQTREKPTLPNVLGLYTQGFWLRLRLGLINSSVGVELVNHEQELLEILVAYIKENPGVELVIFPHPMERRHFQQTGNIPYPTHGLPQIRIDSSGANSIYTFDQVGLGFTTVSTIGFDRIFMGFRTLFYAPRTGFLNLEIPSPYRSLFCTGKNELLEQSERWKAASHADFMQSCFGGPFWEPKAGNE